MQDFNDILKLKMQYENIRGQLKAETDKLPELYLDVAEKEALYRKAKAKAFLTLLAEDQKVTAIPTLVNGKTADIRLLFKVADGILRSTKENIKRLHSSVEASRTLISVAKSEINLK